MRYILFEYIKDREKKEEREREREREIYMD